MKRGTWIWDRQAQRLVDAAKYRARKAAGVAVSDLPRPTVISDAIELKSMVDGEVYTSKARLRSSYRARGYVEVGNEPLQPAPKRRPDRKSIKNAVGKAFARAGIAYC